MMCEERLHLVMSNTKIKLMFEDTLLNFKEEIWLWIV